ncbi:MAG: SDR family NAD(P)-dependent oxidoreductase [Brevefilum sp.]|nr:SDR family NAD(P)-dependent oxidoreductase [Brevefilum sp.]MDW7754865.1 SDR family NAD(P)-dependent oxidoreductase [Brevefilum sp.]
MFDFEGKIIVVTGAAGNLGQAVVKGFLHSNGTVCGLDHRSGRMDQFKSSKEGVGSFYAFDEVDLTDKANMLSLAEQIKSEVGDVNVLVNTVGGFSMGEPVYGISEETWQRMINMNVMSFLNAAEAFVPTMIESGGGKVITIGAKAALLGMANAGAYSAAKAAVLRLTESMAGELKQKNIQVNSVVPGIIDTPQNRKDMPNADFEKWVSPEQVTDAILFLASSSADGISGAAIPVYGRL